MNENDIKEENLRDILALEKKIPDFILKKSISNFIHPRIEGEVAVMTKSVLKGPDCDIDMVLAAIDFAIPAIEIIDSRYENFKFDLKSVVADNTSAAGFVTGSNMKRVEDLDLPTLGVVLEKNGVYPRALLRCF